jgi:hypothetical protein
MKTHVVYNIGEKQLIHLPKYLHDPFEGSLEYSIESKGLSMQVPGIELASVVTVE